MVAVVVNAMAFDVVISIGYINYCGSFISGDMGEGGGSDKLAVVVVVVVVVGGGWLVGWLTASLPCQQHASVSHGRICSEKLYLLPH